MLQQLYSLLIAPRSRHPDHAEREIVLNFLLIGMIVLSVAALLNTVIGFIFFGYDYLLARIAGISLVILMLGGLYYLARYRNYQKSVVVFLLTLAFTCAVLMVYEWGLLLPTGILLFSLVVVMAGILSSAKHALFLAVGTIFVLVILQIMLETDIVTPNLVWMQSRSTTGDVIGFSTLFITIALVSWLFNRQMEMSLTRARKAEKALVRQNEKLEEKVIERTRQLEKEQLEKMQQMYRFAELGHVSTALFHDLANHVSTVSVDIENLHRGQRSDLLQRIDENIHYIDAIVRRVRLQLQGKSHKEKFVVEDEIREVIRVSSYTAESSNVTIKASFPELKRPLTYRGDVLHFRQLIINILANGIESYRSSEVVAEKRIVELGTEVADKNIVISCTDHGSGIPLADQEKVFDPFYTSKEKGGGIGLFIVKQVVERDFGGTVHFTSSKKSGTTFVLTLPMKSHEDRKN